MLLRAVSKKPGKTIAEDVVGHRGDAYWLLDGATPPAGTSYSALTVEYVQRLSESIYTRVLDEDTLTNILRGCIADVAAAMASDVNEDSEWFEPSSTVSIVRVTDTSLEYLMLGDNSLLIELEGSTISETDDRIHTIAREERDLVRKLRRANEENLNAERYLRARKNLIQAELDSRNKDGGYWICSYDPDAVDHAVLGTVKKQVNDPFRVLLVSDGFARLVTHFAYCNDLKQLADAIQREGSDELFRLLRGLEENSSNFKQAASSTHDDASFLLLNNNWRLG